MNEIILRYPNISLAYSVVTRSGVAFECFREIEKGLYGYRLTPGQTLASIRYRDTNRDFFVAPTIRGIGKGGLYITHALQKAGEKPVYVPFVKELPNGGKLEARDMYIEPCGHLYEKNRLSDVLSGNIAEEDFTPNGKPIKENGRGIWYQHCRFRRVAGWEKWRDNLAYFVKL